jgi:hypothetical protein
MTTSAQQKEYFDQHVTGLGYVNRIRWVPMGRTREQFLCCSVASLRGSAQAPDKTYYDVKVTGEKAKELIAQYQEPERAGCKVLIGFRIGDPYLDQWTYQRGPKAGQPGACIKGRLLFVQWAKVDGVLVYKAEPKDGAKPPDGDAEKALDSSSALPDAPALQPEDSQPSQAA